MRDRLDLAALRFGLRHQNRRGQTNSSAALTFEKGFDLRSPAVAASIDRRHRRAAVAIGALDAESQLRQVALALGRAGPGTDRGDRRKQQRDQDHDHTDYDQEFDEREARNLYIISCALQGRSFRLVGTCFTQTIMRRRRK